MVTVSVLLALAPVVLSAMDLVMKAVGPPRTWPDIALDGVAAVWMVTDACATEDAGLLMANVNTAFVLPANVLAVVTTSWPTPEVTVKVPCDEVKEAAWAPPKLRVPAEEVVVNPSMVMAVLEAMS
jgi:hypothetical protein